MNDADNVKPPRAWRLKTLALALVVVGIGLDLWSKSYMQEALGMSPDRPGSAGKIEVIDGFFRFEGNWNTGVTFGIAQGWTEPILIFTVLASAGLCAWLFLTRSRSVLLHVALGMILAGALGNLYDRFKWHKVRDFALVYWKDPRIWEWPAFNVADSMIVVGVCFILGIELFGRRPPPKPAEQPS
jgi:signal peptidase II